MNCEQVPENATLYLYNELPDDSRHELEMHLGHCPACRREVEELRAFHSSVSEHFRAEGVSNAHSVGPSPNLLAASRLRLQDALASAEQSRGLSRFTIDLAAWLHSMRFQPALAALLLMAGFGAGIFATYSTLPRMHDNGAAVASPDVDSASVGAIRGITEEPGSNRIRISYDRLVPDQAQGSVDDPRIQQLLLYAARNNNSGVRLDSLNVLSKQTQDENVREALIYTLRYDKNPGARLKAIDALGGYVKQERRVRDAVLEALLRDENSGVRMKAIEALATVTSDTAVRQSLKVLAERDGNPFIKSESRRLLAMAPDLD